MTQLKVLPHPRTLRTSSATNVAAIPSLEVIVHHLGINPHGPRDPFTESLPFSLNDTTAGTENELQAVVVGWKGDVDLPVTIEQSNYFANIMRRIQTGDTSKRLASDLERFLNSNPENVWENSWIRLSCDTLTPYAQQVLDADLRADKASPSRSEEHTSELQSH